MVTGAAASLLAAAPAYTDPARDAAAALSPPPVPGRSRQQPAVQKVARCAGATMPPPSASCRSRTPKGRANVALSW